jgi:putative ABC transport system permease protein
MTSLFRKFTRWLQRRSKEDELREELQFHLTEEAAERHANGLSEEQARWAARRDLGNVTRLQENTRSLWSWILLEQLAQDVRYGVRLLRKSPGFTFAAVSSLGLGIGANTAIFSLIDAALLRSLPVREPQRLIELLTDRGNGQPFNAFSYPAFVHFRDHATTVDGVIASHSSRFYVAVDNAPPEFESGQYVSGNFFPVLGVPAGRGRTIEPSDDRPAAEPVAVLSHAYWHRRFGADPLVVGRRLTVDDRVFTVVGVTPQSFRGTHVGREVDFWIPLSAEPLLRKESWMPQAGPKWLQLLARVKTGHSYEEARAELQTMFQTGVIEAELALLKNRRPDHPARKWRLAVEPARAGLSNVRDQYGDPLFVLFIVSGIVLVIACVNVANLLLARASVRRREIAMRLSLGAAPSRILRQLLTESILLASAGAVLGVAFAFVGSRYLLGFFATSRTPLVLDVGPDVRVLTFAAAVAITTGLLFGLAPAWRTTADAPGSSLFGSGRVQGNRNRRVLSRLLIGTQVALSVIMLFCGGLFLRSLHNIRSIDMGFESRSVLLISTDPSRSPLTSEGQRNALREALTRVNALPGVQAASLSDVTPIEGGGTMLTFELRGTDDVVREGRSLYLAWVSPNYFATMDTPIYLGRDFSWRDSAGSPKVAIVNQTLARQYFGDKNAIGARVVSKEDGTTYEIIAVVGDAKYLELRETVPPTLYLHALQQERVSSQFAIRAAGPPMSIATAARETIREIAPSIPVTSIRSLQEQVDASIAPERMLGALSGFFASLGLVLATVGLYGVMAYSVSRRTSEIGIRIALGAKQSQIRGMVIREALTLTGGGIAAGMIAALLVSRAIASLLFGLTPNDPVTIWGVVVIMVLTGLAAAYLPSRRAAQLDPAVALRNE